jgi:hypothetical protein
MKDFLGVCFAAGAAADASGQTLLTIGVIVALVGNVLTMIQGRITQKRQVQIVADPVSHAEFQLRMLQTEREIGELKSGVTRLHERLDGFFAELQAQREAMQCEFKKDRHDLHERINDLLTAVAKLQGALGK